MKHAFKTTQQTMVCQLGCSIWAQKRRPWI